jgi:hypothetical protein
MVLKFPTMRQSIPIREKHSKDDSGPWSNVYRRLGQATGVNDKLRQLGSGDVMPHSHFQEVFRSFTSAPITDEDETYSEWTSEEQALHERTQDLSALLSSGSSEASEDDILLNCSDSSEDFNHTELQQTDRSRFSPTLRSFGLQVITYLRIELEALFNGAPYLTSRPEPSASNDSSRTASQGKLTPGQFRCSSSKRTTAEGGSESADDNQDDAPDRKRRLTLPSASIGLSLCSKLACPFFKNNPTKYQSWRTCPGPGWDSVHRVK